MAGENGLTLELRPGSWTEVRAAFERGELDLLTGMFANEDRARHQLFSVPHSLVSFAILSREGASEPQVEADLGGKRILVQQGDIAWEYLRAKGFEVVGVSSPEAALRALAAGQGDCAVLNRATGLFLLHRDGWRGLTRSRLALLPQKYCFTVAMDRPDLLASLNEGLFSLKESGKFAEITARHFGAIESQELPLGPLMKRTLVVLLPVAVLLLALFVWTLMLRRLVAQRTRALQHELRERSRAEEALRASDTMLQLVLNTIPLGVFWKDVHGAYLGCNAAFAEYAGLANPAEVVGLSDLDMPWEDYAGTYRAEDRTVVESGRALREIRGPSRDAGGRNLLLDTTKVPLENESGQVIGVLGVCEDVTERQKAEDEIQQSQEKFRAIFDASPISISLTDPETGAYVDANPRLCEVLGMSKEALVGRTPAQLGLTLEEHIDRDVLRVLEREGFIDGMELKATIPWVGERILLVTVRPVLIGGRRLNMMLAMNITERKRTEQAIQESERRLHTLFEGSPIGIFRSTPEGRILQVNPAAAAMFRYKDPQTMVEEVNRLGIPGTLYQSQERRSRLMGRLQARTGTWIVEEMHFRRRDGSSMDGIMSIILHAEPANGLPWLFGFLQDITERKRAEEEILQLKNYMAEVIDSMPAALAGLDREGRVTQWNRGAEDLLGVPAAEARGRTIEELAKEFAPWVAALREQIRREPRPATMEKLLLERDGERRFYDLMLYPLVAEGMEGAVVRIQDSTERVRIEALMIQTEKMMSIGGLAAGMAHEINNPLGIISQAAQIIERRLSADLPANRAAAQSIGLDLELLRAYSENRQISRFLGGILEAVTRAARIVSNMLQFSRQADSTRHPASLSELMEQALDLAANDYDLKKKFDFRSIEIRREFEPGLPSVPVVAIEIEQVFLNLLKNAAQAMVSNPPGRPPSLIIRSFHAANHVVVEVEDNGPGMEEAVRRRIFEPFFTTKEPGAGTGLGLSVSYAIITQNHKGLMEVVSTPGRGSRFTLRLPMMREREDA